MTVPGSGSHSWASVVVPAPDGDVHARIFRPTGPRRGWLVWAHGGSWTRGSIDDWHPACADLAAAAGCTLVSVGYRLAPRYPHPAALVDVLAVMDWTAARARHEGADTRLAVGGDSAGGTVAACAALTWRDLGRPLAAQLLSYPPLDPRCRSDSYARHPTGFPTRAEMLSAWSVYRGRGYRASSRYSTPFEATDLRGAAPAVLAVGSLDPVAGDLHCYARRLRTAGTRVQLREFPGLGHGAFLLPADGAADNPVRHWLGTTFHDLLAETTARERA